MKKIITLLLICTFCCSLTGREEKRREEKRREEKRREELLRSEIYPCLQEDLWHPRNAYDSGMALLIPLHYAFKYNDCKLQAAFSKHFCRFVDFINSPAGVSWDNISLLDREHYLLLLSFFVKNCEKYNKKELISSGTIEVLERFIANEWYFHRPPWSKKRFPMKIHLERILSGEKVYPEYRKQYSYYRVFTDLELFPLAIMGNMYSYYKTAHINNKVSDICKSAMKYVMRFLYQEIKWDKERKYWAMQPGLWKEHPDFAYSGYEYPRKIMPKKVAANIEWDVLHAQRHPVFLYFWQEAADSKEDKDYIGVLRKTLFEKLIAKIFVAPTPQIPYWRSVNNMNGSNGLYRWNKKTNSGYLPYGHSHALLYGWYAFEAPESIKKIYRDISLCFPMNIKGRSVYSDTKTTREQNPHFKHSMKYGHAWDMFELLVRLAALK